LREDLSRDEAILLKHLQADCLLDKRRFTAAIETYDSILSSVEDSAAYANRGLAKWELKKYRAAVDDYSRAAAIDPNDVTVQRSLGELQNKLGCNAEAAKHLEKAVRLDPSSARSFCALGIAYYNLQSWVKAYRSLKRAAQLDPNSRIALLGIKKIEDHFEL
jgi:tetratricopeptide (TPR) repeat protein